MIETDRFAKIEVTSAGALRAWLEQHHGQSDSVWLVTFKKHVAGRYVGREAVLDELIAFGWIDGIRRKLDADRTMQLIGPRRHDVWALSYKQRAARLIADGRMHAAGLKAIEAAKRQGLWDAMADVDALRVPDDLQAALEAMPPAAAWFAAAAPSYRRNVLHWIKLAKKAETRATRIARTAELAARGEKVAQM
ncbi:MAG: YdeI family protein [Geminicoccaceae bacterium]